MDTKISLFVGPGTLFISSIFVSRIFTVTLLGSSRWTERLQIESYQCKVPLGYPQLRRIGELSTISVVSDESMPLQVIPRHAFINWQDTISVAIMSHKFTRWDSSGGLLVPVNILTQLLSTQYVISR